MHLINIQWVRPIGNTRAFDQKCCPLPSLLPIGINFGLIWAPIRLKVLPIGLTHCITLTLTVSVRLLFVQENSLCNLFNFKVFSGRFLVHLALFKPLKI
jgi:hypothetical protein